MIPKERSFLELLAYGKDKRQKYQVIKFINKSQYYFLKKIATNILQGIIPLKKHQLNHLKSSKILIRKLAEGRVTSSDLVRHCMSISYIVKIALEHYEKRSKTSTGSNRKWKQIGDNSPMKEVSVETAPLMNPQVQRKVISQLKVNNQEGSGKIEKLNPTQMFLYLSPKKRSKGSLLLHYLENSENIQWKKNGEVVYKQKVIPNSNIITLITHAIQNNKSKPVGMKSFYKILAKANIPSKLISN